MAWGNKQEEICTPMPMKVSTRSLKNQETFNSSTFEKTMQIISQNKTHTSVVMPSLVLSEQGEGSYRLNCNESRVFNYITEVRLWTDGFRKISQFSKSYASSK
jgi:hypothetical protein